MPLQLDVGEARTFDTFVAQFGKALEGLRARHNNAGISPFKAALEALTIASLLSNDNRWVNAQRIEVSGGMAI